MNYEKKRKYIHELTETHESCTWASAPTDLGEAAAVGNTLWRQMHVSHAPHQKPPVTGGLLGSSSGLGLSCLEFLGSTPGKEAKTNTVAGISWMDGWRVWSWVSFVVSTWCLREKHMISTDGG